MATSLDDLPLRIRHVKIVGNNRTRPYVVEDQLQVWGVGRVSIASQQQCLRHISSRTRRIWHMPVKKATHGYQSVAMRGFRWPCSTAWLLSGWWLSFLSDRVCKTFETNQPLSLLGERRGLLCAGVWGHDDRTH